MRIVITVAHHHTWLWTGSFLETLRQFPPPVIPGFETRIVVVNNSPGNPSIRVVTDTELGAGVEVIENTRPYLTHGTALDSVVEKYQPDYLFTLETDVLLSRKGWFEEFFARLEAEDAFVAGAWHHESFINPSAALYRGGKLLTMRAWCLAQTPTMRWGERFAQTTEFDNWAEMASQSGPFNCRLGWPEGTTIFPAPSGQMKGPGHYEPGQALFHFGMASGGKNAQIETTTVHDRGIPVGTYYGPREWPWMVHHWGGSRSFGLLEFADDHPANADPTNRDNREFWLRREAEIWLRTVPEKAREQTLALMRKYGWYHSTRENMTPRQQHAVNVIEGAYRSAGVPL